MLKEILKAKKTGQKVLNLNGLLLNKSAKEINEIFNEISKLTNLTDLDLSGNKLTDLPEAITKLTNLTYLDLNDNQL
ncbi:MAG: leucine-rich repeat domain-containing protein, partial [Deltaproteobacteria bacterium]|nr:leucine-rich repeat domain-containing protein [Deltaproteobacteria bacterium]